MAVTSATDACEPPRRKVALITGINGQDGSYLAELLLTKGYTVVGIKRRASSFNQPRLDAIFATHPRAKNMTLHYGDVSDTSALAMLMHETKPDEVYNLAAQSHVAVSFVMPKYTAEVDALGALNLLESIRLAGLEKTTRFYQASTSEMFGLVQEVPQRETTPFYPRSPYACAKLYAHALTVNYRESYGIFACSGILFNHESPRRGENFVTRKITRAVAAIAAGAQECVMLGNLDARRDWGHARDYVTAMWAMLQADVAADYVIATGETRTVRCFCDAAFAAAGLGPLLWRGTGTAEVGVSARTGAVLVRVSERYYRPAEVELLIGDPGKAVRELGFNPRATSFEELVAEMVASDMAEHAAQARIADAVAKAAAPQVAFVPAATQTLCDVAALAAAAVEASPAEDWGFLCVPPEADDKLGAEAASSDEEAPRAACGGVAARVADLEARVPQLMSGHDA